MTAVLLQGDCREFLPGLRADLVLTDPPYGSTPQHWDVWPAGWVGQAAQTGASSLWCFGSARMFLDHVSEFSMWKFAEDVVWEKHNGSRPDSRRFRRVHELAYHWYQGLWRDVYAAVPRIPREGPARAAVAGGKSKEAEHQGKYADRAWHDDGTRLVTSVVRARSLHRAGTHSAQKPDKLLRYLIEASCPPGGTVLDPFAGSGAVLRAALALGRSVIGIEQDPGTFSLLAREFEGERNDVRAGLPAAQVQ